MDDFIEANGWIVTQLESGEYEDLETKESHRVAVKLSEISMIESGTLAEPNAKDKVVVTLRNGCVVALVMTFQQIKNIMLKQRGIQWHTPHEEHRKN